MKQLAEACPRFQRCAVNACPLDTGYGRTLAPHPDDAERKCRLPRVRRQALAAKYPELAAKLRFGGLNGLEYTGLKRTSAMTAEQKAAFAKKGQGLRFLARVPRKSGRPHGDRPITRQRNRTPVDGDLGRKVGLPVAKTGGPT